MVKELQEAVRQLGIEVRLEKGRFRGGQCIISGEKFIVLNKNHPPEAQFAILADSLRDQPLESIYLPPVIRSEIERMWQRKESADDAISESETEPEL